MIIGKTKTDPNKILPFRYPWAREYYKMGVANNWVPEEISMIDDVEMWKSDKISSAERHLIMRNLGFFSTAESLTANNIVLALYDKITDPGCRQYLLRQAYEESIHSDTFIYCCDSLGLDPEEVYTMYQTVPSIKEKDDFVIDLTKTIFDKNFEIKTSEDVQMFLRDLIGYYSLFEGIAFYSGFVMMLALKRQNKMIGIGEQFEFILRDESVHLAFGCDLINAIKQENTEVWTDAFANEVVELVKRMVELECAYTNDCCPGGMLGINAESFHDYVKHIADRRLVRLGLEEVYQVANPFPWMSQSTDLVKEKNFFESRVTDYSVGALKWEE